MHHAVYRVYDAEKRLLYVGMSLNPIRRLDDHKNCSVWHEHSALVTIEWFETKGLAAKVEAAAILVEKPVFNKSGIMPVQGVSRDPVENTFQPRTPSRRPHHRGFFCLETEEAIIREAARMRQVNKRSRDRARSGANKVAVSEVRAPERSQKLISLAREYGVHTMTIRRWIASGKIPNPS